LKQHLAPFPHRFAMVALAATEHPHFVPSLAEAGEDFSGTQLHYSVDTVRYFRQHINGQGDRIFFIIGADAFLDIPMWKEYETLLGLCDFVIANRPGIRLEALRLVIPPTFMGDGTRSAKKKRRPSRTARRLWRGWIERRCTCWKTWQRSEREPIFGGRRAGGNRFTFGFRTSGRIHSETEAVPVKLEKLTEGRATGCRSAQEKKAGAITVLT